VLLGVNDVAVVRGDEVGDGSNHAPLIGARKQENTGCGHPESLLDLCPNRTSPRLVSCIRTNRRS
jgi:hypothetical protein